MGLKKAYGSPNGAMRRGWNGITISRDTIHIEGVELGFKNPVLFERHAVGGEYGAGWAKVGKGTLLTVCPKICHFMSFCFISAMLLLTTCTLSEP
jgi:isocitrate dehydrogenase